MDTNLGKIMKDAGIDLTNKDEFKEESNAEKLA
jgi:hypothetical protein